METAYVFQVILFKKNIQMIASLHRIMIEWMWDANSSMGKLVFNTKSDNDYNVKNFSYQLIRGSNADAVENYVINNNMVL